MAMINYCSDSSEPPRTSSEDVETPKTKKARLKIERLAVLHQQQKKGRQLKKEQDQLQKYWKGEVPIIFKGIWRLYEKDLMDRNCDNSFEYHGIEYPLDYIRVPYIEVIQSKGNITVKTRFPVAINKCMRWKSDKKIYFGSKILLDKYKSESTWRKMIERYAMSYYIRVLSMLLIKQKMRIGPYAPLKYEPRKRRIDDEQLKQYYRGMKSKQVWRCLT